MNYAIQVYISMGLAFNNNFGYIELLVNLIPKFVHANQTTYMDSNFYHIILIDDVDVGYGY